MAGSERIIARAAPVRSQHLVAGGEGRLALDLRDGALAQLLRARARRRALLSAPG